MIDWANVKGQVIRAYELKLEHGEELSYREYLDYLNLCHEKDGGQYGEIRDIAFIAEAWSCAN